MQRSDGMQKHNFLSRKSPNCERMNTNPDPEALFSMADPADLCSMQIACQILQNFESLWCCLADTEIIFLSSKVVLEIN